MNEAGPSIDMVLIIPEAMQALLENDVDRASAVTGVSLPAWFLEHERLWEIRLDDLRRNPAFLPWLPRAVVALPSREVIGLAGFHDPPDERGRVEISYWIAPEHRRQGYGRAAARALIKQAAAVPEVTVVRASISPDNAASLALVRPLGFVQIGEQWDEIDGLELVFERPIEASDRPGMNG